MVRGDYIFAAVLIAIGLAMIVCERLKGRRDRLTRPRRPIGGCYCPHCRRFRSAGPCSDYEGGWR